MVLNSFLSLNCFTCFNESSNNFNILTPTIEDNVPLHEIIEPAPNVLDTALGDVNNYYIQTLLFYIHNVVI